MLCRFITLAACRRRDAIIVFRMPCRYYACLCLLDDTLLDAVTLLRLLAADLLPLRCRRGSCRHDTLFADVFCRHAAAKI